MGEAKTPAFGSGTRPLRSLYSPTDRQRKRKRGIDRTVIECGGADD